MSEDRLRDAMKGVARRLVQEFAHGFAAHMAEGAILGAIDRMSAEELRATAQRVLAEAMRLRDAAGEGTA